MGSLNLGLSCHCCPRSSMSFYWLSKQTRTVWPWKQCVSLIRVNDLLRAGGAACGDWGADGDADAESYTAVWMEVCAAPRGTLGRKQPSRWITRADVMDTPVHRQPKTRNPKPRGALSLDQESRCHGHTCNTWTELACSMRCGSNEGQRRGAVAA